MNLSGITLSKNIPVAIDSAERLVCLIVSRA
jgi:hypothetical protein